MQSIIMIFSALVATTIATPLPPVSPVPTCHGIIYDPSQYQCYANQLCPIINGDIQLTCDTACYSKYNYTCSIENKLAPLPHVSGPFVVQVLASTSNLNGSYVQACTRRFWIGEGPCTSCPQNASQAGKCSNRYQTQLFEGSALNVQVPGGQKYFLDADGALSFTAPNSSITPRGAVLNATAYQNGMFAYDEVNFPPSAWVACPKINGSSHTGSRAIANGVWQVFGQLKGVNFHAQQGCQGITLLAKAVQNGSVAAYEYT